MPAVASCLHSFQLGRVAKASTGIRAATTPFSLKLPLRQASSSSSSFCGSHGLLQHHLDSTNFKRCGFTQACRVMHHPIKLLSHDSSSPYKHPLVPHNLQQPHYSSFKTSHAGLDSEEHIQTQRRVTTHAVRVEDLSPAAPKPDEEEPVDIKVPVGFVGELTDTVFTIQKVLPQPSILLTVTLPKPLGIVFEESRIRKRVTVAELVAGGNAERLARVVQMFGSVSRLRPDGAPVRVQGAVQVGDVLRGLTTTQCIVDLFGVRAPRRATVYFDTQNRRWGEIMGAFGAVRVSDGDITLVLERRLERSQVH